MESPRRSDSFCILGAGTSGLTVLKNFLAQGIPCECFEREDDVGGNWYYGRPHSSVYRSTRLISSKRLTEYADFPMPAEYPEYPDHVQVWEYLKSYARRFGLYEHIRFNCGIERIERDAAGWLVRFADGSSRSFRGLVIANGHNWDPHWPQYPGEFHGTILHSSQYKTPDALAGKRVLVVGAGNSGCDIAVEGVQHAAQTWLSMRRGYHYLPKYFNGKPIDQCNERLLRWRIPLALRRWITYWAIRLAVGTPERFGLPRPDHKLFETHPIINSQIFYYAAHGQLRAKPDVAELCGDRVRFVDGSEEPIDVIVYATGFKISFPFVDHEHLNWRDGRPDLYLNVFHPERDDLFVAGLIQPDSGQWGLVDRQAQLIARYVAGLEKQAPAARRFREEKRRAGLDLGDGVRYILSPRHLLEVEHFSYRRRLDRLIQRLS